MEMNQNTYGKSEQILTVGETGGATVEMAQQYSDPESQELSMIFQFELMGIDGIRRKKKDGTACSGETMIFRVSYRALEMTGNRIGKNQQKCWLSFSMG